ncbi:hypothetical protein P154DRAFT_570988 [Amniculicola lignicola CBS 123094]|uniref:Uncharacterized protein n=1 Tax=Amniculicola lignicola CBS 123094 TaxID=1392246 RepID=A0A6A5WX44_9PLEO|nr:hypothetical protein P154DRAFT_570988 [Amniculicola lignicola CBS 123094]
MQETNTSLISFRDFSNKRIGITGEGATGVQTTTAISKEPTIKSLTVFQRTALWIAPLSKLATSIQKNGRVSKEIRQGLPAICQDACWILHIADPRKTLDVTEEELVALCKKLYNESGFEKWMGVFSDTSTNRQANEMYSKFMAEKVRARVHDPVTADKLHPQELWLWRQTCTARKKETEPSDPIIAQAHSWGLLLMACQTPSSLLGLINQSGMLLATSSILCDLLLTYLTTVKSMKSHM